MDKFVFAKYAKERAQYETSMRSVFQVKPKKPQKSPSHSIALHSR